MSDGNLEQEAPETKRLKLDIGTTVEEEQCSSRDATLEESGPRLGAEAEDSAAVFVKQKDVGITEYISSHAGFFGILKQRYADFLVHEIAQDGSVVQLTDLSIPVEKSEEKAELERVFSSDEVEQLKTLAESSDNTACVELKASEDKKQRTIVHKAIRDHFPMLDSVTLAAQGGGCAIKIFHCTAKKDSRNSWPQDRGKYCKFVLYKENRDTMEAVHVLSKLLKMKPKNLLYAGTKDRRAITTQNITVFRVTAERLLALNDSCKGMVLGNFEYVSDSLRLGSLLGNQFTIVLRSVSCEDHVIRDAVASLHDAGFINYFGMQRFGTSTIPSYKIGRCLLHSDWQGAIDFILKPRPGEPDELSSARQYYWETKDAAGALARYPRRRSTETQLLQGLEKCGAKNDLLGALNFIPRNSRMMYVHSYQSLVWNRIVSWRIQECGLKPVPGDLVWKRDDLDPAEETPDKASEVGYVTEENLSQYTILDVVLPLPGYDVLLPKHKVGEQYHKVLEEDGLSIEQLRHKVREFSLHGSYRNLVIKPKKLSWEILYYNDVTLPLALSDLDILQDKPQPQSIPGGKYKALKIQFSLPSSTYATMAVRELLKMETSSHYQAQLNPVEDATPLQ